MSANKQHKIQNRGRPSEVDNIIVTLRWLTTNKAGRHGWKIMNRTWLHLYKRWASTEEALAEFVHESAIQEQVERPVTLCCRNIGIEYIGIGPSN